MQIVFCTNHMFDFNIEIACFSAIFGNLSIFHGFKWSLCIKLTVFSLGCFWSAEPVLFFSYFLYTLSNSNKNMEPGTLTMSIWHSGEITESAKKFIHGKIFKDKNVITVARPDHTIAVKMSYPPFGTAYQTGLSPHGTVHTAWPADLVCKQTRDWLRRIPCSQSQALLHSLGQVCHLQLGTIMYQCKSANIYKKIWLKLLLIIITKIYVGTVDFSKTFISQDTHFGINLWVITFVNK